MDEIAGRTGERSRQLAAALQPTFSNREDAELAASMLVNWLQAEHGDLIKQADWARYLAALDELPNSAPSPRVFYVSIYDQDIEPHWRVTFTLDPRLSVTAERVPARNRRDRERGGFES